MDTYRIRVIIFSGIQFRTGYQNQAKSSLEQGQVSGGPAAHPHQNFCSVLPPREINTPTFFRPVYEITINNVNVGVICDVLGTK